MKNLVLMTVLLLPGLGQAQLEEKARKVVEERAEGILSLDATLKVNVSFQGQNQEVEQTLNHVATVFSKDGLLVTTNSVFEATLPAQLAGRATVKAEVVEIKVLSPDGEEEWEADLVFQDSDLDLAFLKLKEEREGLKPIDFSETELSVLDDLVIINRLAPQLDRGLDCLLTKVTSELPVPRRFFRTNKGLPGVPAFNPDGKAVGFFINRVINGNPTLVILPGKDFVKVAAEAMSGEGEESESKEAVSEDEEAEGEDDQDAID